MEKKSVGLLELETAVLECFLEKTPLSPLGVNYHEGAHSSPLSTGSSPLLQVVSSRIINLRLLTFFQFGKSKDMSKTSSRACAQLKCMARRSNLKHKLVP
jgi:hypothetical protein